MRPIEFLSCLLEASDEVDVIDNFKRLIIDTSNAKDPHELNYKLTNYISRDLEFNKIIPYCAKFRGPLLKVDTEGAVTDKFEYSPVWQDILIFPERVQFLPCPEKGDKDELVYSTEYSIPYLVVRATRMDDLDSGKSATFAIPISENLLVQSNIEYINPINVSE